MSQRIGQALIERGLITARQLDEALQVQLICGGTLGTCLVELGSIDETALGRTLAELLETRHAPRQVFEEIPPAVVATLDVDTVRKCRVVPFGIERTALHVAVIDPRNLHALSVSSGYRIIPYVAPEIRVLQAMERYYGIARRPRFVRLAQADDPIAARVAARSRSRSGHGVAGVAPGPVRAPSPVTAPRRQEDPAGLDGLSARLSHAEALPALGEALLDWLVAHATRGILFEIDRDAARVTGWRELKLDRARVRSLRLPVVPQSVFGLALDDGFYRGPLPSGIDVSSFYVPLRLDVPCELAVLPLYGEARLEAVVYADGGPAGSVREPVIPRSALLDRVALAMRMLAIKRQLRGEALVGAAAPVPAGRE